MTQHIENQQQEIRPSGQNFSFDIVLASHYGIEEALLIHHFQHWIRINKTKGTNFIDDRTWTYQSTKDIADHFPFLNPRQVKYAIDNLVEKKVILAANYNKCPIDKTLWYSFVREDIFVPDIPINSKNVYERQNCQSKDKIVTSKDKIVKAIPDTKTNAKTTNTTTTAAVFFGCLEKVDIPQSEKIWISKKYDEKTVCSAVAYATNPNTKIKTSLIQVIKWACETKPDIPISKQEGEIKNKELAEKWRQQAEIPKGCQFEVLNKYVEIFCGGNTTPFILEYSKSYFKETLKEALKKYGIKTK